LYIRQETSSERRGILFGGDSPPPAADFERITGKAPMAPDSPWAHVKPSCGDCYNQCLAVVAELRAEERDRLERAATMRQTRNAAAHAAPSPIPSSFLQQLPREQGARPTAAARAAALAEEAMLFSGPCLSEMRIKGSSVLLVNMGMRDDANRTVNGLHVLHASRTRKKRTATTGLPVGTIGTRKKWGVNIDPHMDPFTAPLRPS
jgi:hypothetical protein